VGVLRILVGRVHEAQDHVPPAPQLDVGKWRLGS
jgi:hypothetical protein